MRIDTQFLRGKNKGNLHLPSTGLSEPPSVPNQALYQAEPQPEIVGEPRKGRCAPYFVYFGDYDKKVKDSLAPLLLSREARALAAQRSEQTLQLTRRIAKLLHAVERQSLCAFLLSLFVVNRSIDR